MLSADEIAASLGLKPHPEGGYYTETYRSGEKLRSGLPPRYAGARALSTAIYYLLTPDTFSAIHRLKSDEVYHFYAGDAVEMLQLLPDGTGRVLRLGNDLNKGALPQVVVERGIWQGSRLASGGRFALLGTTVAPGFEFADYEAGVREELVRDYPEFKDLICHLTRG